MYIYEHSNKGAMGIVINKSLHNITLGTLLQHLDIEVKDEVTAALPVLSGGPVGPEQGFVVHGNPSMDKKARQVLISASKKTLRDISVGKGPEQFIILLGYAGWGGGQLEKEINRNDWLIAPYSSKILFDTPIEKRWAAAAETIGVDINQLSDQVGHA